MSANAIPAPAPRHRGLWLGLALGALGLHLLALTRYGWFRDELYYVACARRLAWGYVDQPPLSIALLALIRAIFGESLVVLRLAAALGNAAIVYFTARLAREMGGGRFAQGLAGLAALLTPVFLAVGHFYSMNVFDVLFWTLAALATIAALREGGVGRWAWLGVILGLGLLNKISIIWLGLGWAVGLILTSHRRHLRTPGPYVAAAIALICFAPHVLWQIAHHWPTLEFMRNATTHKMRAVSPWAFLVGQFTVMGPGNVLVDVPGLVFGLFAPRARPWRIFAISFLAVAALLISAGTSRASYLSVAYPPLFALGAVAWEGWTRRVPTLARAALVVLVTLIALPSIPLALPILPVETLLRYQAALGLAPSTEERKRVGPLPQHDADMFGWNELVAEVAKAAARLTPEERARAVIFGQNYGEAGAIEVLGRGLGLPRVISAHNNYWLWGPGPWDGRVMIIIGGDRRDNAAFFDHVDVVGRWDHPLAMPYERGLDISIARGFKGSIADAWAELKNYD
ncbi:MAG: glycosyltransferase family 39 protein [Candidatus Eisenbacteria bacterium]|uniref:Glycosyltransferase family 39 protein n=1 Tax=Eiseniibacteriota bacterium TaxID=2212470 RepID=A0A538U824_UNCEI|nr:MAG: glycosyltransferase family 39 protein [Candidatus Eisenbacteria bacterium]